MIRLLPKYIIVVTAMDKTYIRELWGAIRRIRAVQGIIERSIND